jgi:hypothetical protein
LKARTHPAPPGWITSREIGGFHDVCVQPGYDATIRHWLLTDAAAACSTCAAVKNYEKKNLRYVCIAGESKASLEETNRILSTTYDGFVTLKNGFAHP